MHSFQRHPVETIDLAAIVDEFDLSWEKLRNQTVCITGAAGFLPSYMVETMLYLNETRQFGIQVLAVGRNRAGLSKRFAHHSQRPDLICIEQDISRPFKLVEKPDYIIHAASQASPKYYSTDPVGTLSANTIGTAALLELARTSKSKGFLYFSSSEVYGQPAHIPTNETDFGVIDPTNVRACYAESKRMGENMCVSWEHQYGVPVKIVRPFHTYGPRMQLDDGRVYADFVASILRNKPIVLTSDGLATRAFCYSADAVAGFWKVLLEGESGESYNIGNPEGEISMRALGALLTGLYPEKQLTVSYVNRKAGDTYMPSDIMRGCPDIGKAAALGWKPRTTLTDGFRRTIESYL